MRNNHSTLLVLEDDASIAHFLSENLISDGYEVVIADSAHDGLRLLEYKEPDLALIDLGLPDGSGLDVIEQIRCADFSTSRLDPKIPIVVLSGRAGELDRLRGFERGCDDYVTKPFSYPELRARIKALLARAEFSIVRQSNQLRVGQLEIDTTSREVSLEGWPVQLSQKEYALLCKLAANPTQVFSKEELLRDVWGYRVPGNTRTLDSHACRLRAKLSLYGDRFIVNVWGVGYRLVDRREA